MAIDLRSDTVTRPDAGMRAAIARAEVGDDVLGDDPTVLRLQEQVANLLGHESALFTPSGTMANQIALLSQSQRGDEVLIDRFAHILLYESEAGAALAGVQFRDIDSPAGGFDVAHLEPLVRPSAPDYPRTRLVAIENTHAHRGGEILALDRMQRVRAWSKARGLGVHLDGARLWNASVTTGIPVAEFAACADTVTVCFSKGLGAPVGSALVSDAPTIRVAHHWRKMLGGGMRQAGVLAAAALYGLEHNLPRLADDHVKARLLADAIADSPGLVLARPVQTNIVIVAVQKTDDSPARLVEDLEREGVRCSVWDDRCVRMVTHLDVSMEDARRAAAVLRRVRR